MTYIYTEYDYLAHHGVKGMRWGVRRYQNYDGSYTQAGLKRYNIAKKNLDASSEAYSNAKKQYKAGTITKLDLNRAKNEYEEDKRTEKKYYKNLKINKLADQGKALYNRGVTITNNYDQESLISAASVTAASLLNNYGQTKAAIAVATGGIAVSAGLGIYHAYQNKRLRAYYSHSHLPMPEDKTSKKETLVATKNKPSTSAPKGTANKTRKVTEAMKESAWNKATDKFNNNIERLNKEWDKKHPESVGRTLTGKEAEAYDKWMMDQYNKYYEEYLE